MTGFSRLKIVVTAALVVLVVGVVAAYGALGDRAPCRARPRPRTPSSVKSRGTGAGGPSACNG